MAGSTLNRGFTFVLRLLIGGLFIYAGASKVGGAQEFAVAIMNYRLVPWDVAVMTAFYLPWIEMVAGAGLVVRRLFSGSLAIIGGLLVIFAAATLSAAARGLDITCGCFGTGGAVEPAWLLLLRDGVLLTGVLVLALGQWRHNSCTRRLNEG